MLGSGKLHDCMGTMKGYGHQVYARHTYTYTYMYMYMYMYMYYYASCLQGLRLSWVCCDPGSSDALVFEDWGSLGDCGLGLGSFGAALSWGFPKIGDPNVAH